MDLEEYLAQFAEPIPEWLDNYLPNSQETASDILAALLRSRTVYYPGSGDDGIPVTVFNSSHAAHCFIYVDYLITRNELLRIIENRGFYGYTHWQCIEIAEVDFRLGRWQRNYHNEVRYPIGLAQPYAFISIFERKPDFDDRHGARRFAVLFLAADGIAAFDAIFCQTNGTPPPFCAVIQDHGFGGNYAPGGFGGCGPMAEIADRCGVFPHFLLKDIEEDRTRNWPSYVRCLAADGTAVRARPMGGAGHSRGLWQRRATQGHHVPRT